MPFRLKKVIYRDVYYSNYQANGSQLIEKEIQKLRIRHVNITNTPCKYYVYAMYELSIRRKPNQLNAKSPDKAFRMFYSLNLEIIFLNTYFPK